MAKRLKTNGATHQRQVAKENLNNPEDIERHLPVEECSFRSNRNYR